ncbi:hypothetical protein ILUMI_10771, partial [Ignelater luminosus]
MDSNSTKKQSKLESAVAFTIIMATVFSQGRCQQHLQVFLKNAQKDLPKSTRTDMLSILANDSINALRRCTGGIYNTSLVQYWLFTRQAPNTPKIITSSNQIDFRKTTKILIHGWGGNANVYYIRLIKDAYLKKRDYNIISVNFPKYAETNYPRARCNTPIVGRIISEFICDISNKMNIKHLHIIGHSLGAHVAGVAGNETRQKCNRRIGRITGLDPAGPLFQHSHKSVKLDGDDALTVDVIHTNQGQLGYTGKCGTIDFYLNCGYQQSKCLSIIVNSMTKVKTLVKLPTAI